MYKQIFGIIYTGESNLKLKELTQTRSIAALPFGGRYRCIDFMLSSLVNSGARSAGIIVQSNYHSLMDHLGPGKEWDLSRKRDGLFILPPFITKENTGSFNGSVDALKSAMGYIRRSTQHYCILMGGHTIFNMTFEKAIEQHLETGADITVVYNTEKPTQAAREYADELQLILENNRIRMIGAGVSLRQSNYISMGIYILDKNLLIDLIEDALSQGNMDFSSDVLCKKQDSLKLYGYRYGGYVARINSPQSYFRHSMGLLNSDVRNDLFNSSHPVYTKIRDKVPAIYAESAKIKNSIVADGCIIEGEVENCVLFRGVHIAKGARVKNSIIMQDCELLEESETELAILDKQVVIKHGSKLIGSPGFPEILRKGMVL